MRPSLIARPGIARGWWQVVAVMAFVIVGTAACGGSAHHLWVANERPEPVVIVLETLDNSFQPLPDQEAVHYTVPARSEACTYCGTGSFGRARIFIYTAASCTQLGSAILVGADSYVVTVPPTGLVVLDHGARIETPDVPQLRPAETRCT